MVDTQTRPKEQTDAANRACPVRPRRWTYRDLRSRLSAELKLAGEQSGGDWAVVESHVRAGDEPPMHTHTREDETVCVLDGAITVDVGAGSYAALPKNLPHAVTVRGDEARLRITLGPAGTEYFLVPRDDSDADPAKFGLIIHQAASAM